MAETSIQWTDHSVNPIRFGRGHYCQKISPGCANCYASRFQPRVGNPQFGGVSTALPMAFNEEVPRSGALWLDDSKLREVLRRRKPTKYFWCDMTDLFGNWVPDEFIDKCFATMALTPHHTHQVLTKRAERMAAYANDSKTGCIGAIHEAAKALLGEPVCQGEWPLPNVWLGVSVENQKYAEERIPHLLNTPAAVRFLSCEPLLDRLDLSGLAFDIEPDRGSGWRRVSDLPSGATEIDWVIVGGESGPGARPMHAQWARNIVMQCDAAGVACFVKQMGAKPSWAPSDLDEPRDLGLVDRKGGDMAEWPEDLRVREFPRLDAEGVK